jgi:hypothetical protein
MFLPNGTERPTGFQSWIGKMVKTAIGNTGAGTASLKKKTKTWESPAREKKKVWGKPYERRRRSWKRGRRGTQCRGRGIQARIVDISFLCFLYICMMKIKNTLNLKLN